MAVPDGVGLLERALCYALGRIQEVVPENLGHPTPCAGWDLRTLLDHLNESLLVLGEGALGESVRAEPLPGDGEPTADPVATFRDRARQLLNAWSSAGSDRLIRIGGRPMTASLMAQTGAIEIAVHGWDVAAACGVCRPIPPELAADMLTVCRLVVTEATRYPMFAAPVAISPLASPSDRLVAFLGRRPGG
jgi:uncharacterized protein (TIGR03086 family)